MKDKIIGNICQSSKLYKCGVSDIDRNYTLIDQNINLFFT